MPADRPPQEGDRTERARIASRRVYTGKVLNLDVDRVRFPNGSEGELEMIRHPGASAVVPFLGELSEADPAILLIRQYRYAAEGYLYEVPAGRLEPGESPAECAGRELSEETGWSARKVEHLFTMYTTPGFTDEKIHVFLASDLTRGVTNHDTDEFMVVEKVLLSKAVAMIERGEIQDAKTALSILLASRYRDRIAPAGAGNETRE